MCRDGKAEVGRVTEEKSRSEKIRDGESPKRQDAGARKGREVAIQCVFPMICGSGGSKSILAKAAGAEPAGQMRDEKVRAVVARSTFPSQNVQNTPTSEHFWKLSCRKSARRCGAKHISKSTVSKHEGFGPLSGVQMSEKKHAVAARSTCPSQNVQNTPFSEHFWKLRCRKSARRCGAKHISKSTCTKHAILEHFWKLRCRKSARRCGVKHISKSTCTKRARFGPLLEVEMSKKCTPLWREVHFQVKSVKTRGVRTTF